MPKWTDDQLLAIEKEGSNIIVSAGAGSGKTNEIAWLAHRLASLHDEENKIIFDNIFYITDRNRNSP